MTRRRPMFLLFGLAVFGLGAAAAAPAPAQTPNPQDPAARGASVSPEDLQRAAAAGSVRARFELARLLASRGEGEPALTELGRALESAPSSEELLDAYARLALRLGKPIRALPALEALARLDDGNAETAYLLGVSLLQLGDPAVAGETLERATRLRPDMALAFTALGLARNLEKRYEQALAALSEAQVLSPGDLETEAALAEAEQGLGQLDAAATRAEAVLAKSPHPTAMLVRGLVAMEKQDWPKARSTFETLLTAEPEAARVHYQLSLACARLGDTAASTKHRELYQKALVAQESRIRALRGVKLPAEGKP